ncbi:MAG: FG-GAP repeat protein, partial [Phycisphaerae bacterium]
TRTGTTWTQQAQLTATGGAFGDLFGNAVAISGDTAIVGAVVDDVGANADQGSAYIFTRTGTMWTQQAQLTATGGAANDTFGTSVAISGDTAIVGADFDDVGANINQGSTYVFTRTGTTWTQQAQLTATDGVAPDNFGIAVAISGDTAIVGARYDDVGANGNQGSAWSFSRIGTKWIGPDLSVVASDGAASDTFGISLAISGDTAIVGARYDDVGANADQGSAYIFTRTGSTWMQQAKLTATGGAAGDNFGNSVAIFGDTAIVGAVTDDVGANADQGSAYIFTRTGTTWTQQAQLTATGGAVGDWFGNSVAIFGDTAIVGAHFDDVGANGDQGSAYVFTRTGTTWTQQAQLIATGGAGSDQFGSAVAISGDTAIVAAVFDDVGANVDQGSAYIFTRTGSTWSQQAQLVAAGGASNDNFGGAVAISDDTAIIGAYGDDVGANGNQGSACVFTRSGTTWTQQAQLTATGGAANDYFGLSVAISRNTAIVGAVYDDVGVNSDQGSAYVFMRTGSTWLQQAQLNAADGASFDNFGWSVAISGDTVFVGVTSDDIGAITNQGSASIFDVAAND